MNSLETRFTYHAPTKEKIGQHAAVRAACLDAAKIIDAVVPDGRERSLALSRIEEAMFWANAGIARKGVEE